jgi:hypothetical protein
VVLVLVLGSTAAAAEMEMECVRGDCGDGVRPSVQPRGGALSPANSLPRVISLRLYCRSR